MRASSFLLLFFIIGIGDLVFLSFWPEYRWITKPMILISLIYHYTTFFNKHRVPDRAFIVALFFALLGDIFLLFDGQQYFLLGLGSFLIMQIIYGFLFIRDSFVFNFKKMIVSAILLVILAFFMSTIQGDLGRLKVPVMIYSLIIVLMTIGSIMREKNREGYKMVIIGALLFVISDGFIAWTSFKAPVQYGGVIVMATYIMAQYLIVKGWLKNEINGPYNTKSA